MIPAFQGFLFGGGVNPYVSRVATFYMRENLVPHVARLVDIYRSKRDAMLKGLWEVLKGTDVEISKPEGGFFIWIKLPTGTKTTKKLREAASQVGHPVHGGAGLLHQRRRRGVHPPRLQLGAARAQLRGREADRPGHQERAVAATSP